MVRRLNIRLFPNLALVLMLLCPGGASFGGPGGAGGPGGTIGRYPLPLAEAETLLTGWLQQGEYSVASQLLADGEVVLHGARGGKRIRISIRAHSPLTSQIELLETPGREGIPALRKSWETFLLRSGQDRAGAPPERITSLAEAVVCISTPPADPDKITFTGFLIDGEGTVLTISHDFRERRVFKLLFPSGAVDEGRVLKSSGAKDLTTLASSQGGRGSFFSLARGASGMKLGDRIYMLSCNLAGVVGIQSGTVNKPKATVGGETLWQVELERVFLGSSGSPVVNEEGRLVGVVKGRFRGSDSQGFLIPVGTVRSFLEGR